MAETCTFNFWVFGTLPSIIFDVNIPASAKVADLKRAIKEEAKTKFDETTAQDLRLWKVSIDPITEGALENLSFRDRDALSSILRLASIFSAPPIPDHVHIVVKAPETQQRFLLLNCLVLSERQHQDWVFPVRILKTDTVNALKIRIHDIRSNRLPDFDPLRLELWKVVFPFDRLGFEQVRTVGPKLTSQRLLSEVFSDAMDVRSIHVAIRIPRKDGTQPMAPSSFRYPQTLDDVARLRAQFCDTRKPRAPSTGADPKNFRDTQKMTDATIFCNRPADPCTTLPLSLLHPVFGQFIDDYCNIVPSTEDQAQALDLVAAMTPIYDHEFARLQAIQQVFNKNKKILEPKAIKKFTTDGALAYLVEDLYNIAELKHEVGAKGAEPYMQGSLHFLEATRDHAAKYSFSSLPCLIMLIFGPYIAFAGALWTDRPNVQMLTPAIPCHYHRDDVMMRDMLMRQIAAYRRALVTLEKCYLELCSPNPELRNPTVPYPTHYTPHDSPPISFKYTSFINNRLVYFGEDLSNGDAMCIKFTRTYSKEAHEFCAKEGFTPRLHTIDQLPGNWYMVVMDGLGADYVDLAAFQQDNGTDVSSSEYRTLMDNIGKSLEKLHQAGFVHGDIRDVNILVKKTGLDGTFFLLDFEMSGRIGEVRYPSFTNTVTVRRPEGVCDGAVVLDGHDLEMLRYLSEH